MDEVELGVDCVVVVDVGGGVVVEGGGGGGEPDPLVGGRESELVDVTVDVRGAAVVVAVTGVVVEEPAPPADVLEPG